MYFLPYTLPTSLLLNSEYLDAIATRQVEWQASGDLVVFAANAKEAADAPSNWLHGFREVGAGESSH